MSTRERPKQRRTADAAVEARAPRDAQASTTDVPTARPFLKWAGGKWSLAESIAALLPRDVPERSYREPFLGGGAMFFWLQANRKPKQSFLSDTLVDLVRTYRVVRDQPERLVRALERLRGKHSSEHYYAVRDAFNRVGHGSDIERSSWLIYLNKTCYNGLYRTNRSGSFNVPVGRFVAPRIVDPPRLHAASSCLSGASIEHLTFEHLLDVARPGEVIYLDPPYVPLSRTASFAAYASGFGPSEQARLAEVYRLLDARGCLLTLSNSDTPLVRQLYAGFDLQPIVAARSISAQGRSRLPVTELVVRNVSRWPRSARSR
jgi:DNA adenine methylase